MVTFIKLFVDEVICYTPNLASVLVLGVEGPVTLARSEMLGKPELYDGMVILVRQDYLRALSTFDARSLEEPGISLLVGPDGEEEEDEPLTDGLIGGRRRPNGYQNRKFYQKVG